MSQGLQVFNADGTLRDDVTTRFARIVKRVYIPETQLPYTQGTYARIVPSKPLAKGSFTVPELADWDPFYFCTNGEFAPSYPPDIRISGTTVSWEFWPNADLGTFSESGLLGIKPNSSEFYIGGFWLNVGVY